MLKNKRSERKEKKDFQQVIDLAISKNMEKFQEAVKYQFASYPSLEKISKSKINSEYKKTNLQQQAGKSAEVKQAARQNADNVIQGNPNRIARTDDVGDVNHPQYDHVQVDNNGTPKLDSNGYYVGGTQQKNFSKIEAYDKLITKDYEHYKDGPIEIPPNQYKAVIKHWENKIKKIDDQIVRNRSEGKINLVKKLEEQKNRIQDVKGRTHKSKVSTKDAMIARLRPKMSVGLDIIKYSHKAGIQGAKSSAAISCGISSAMNLRAILKYGKDIDEAMLDIGKDTIKATTSGYVTSSTTAIVGGAMRNSSKKVLQNIAKKNGAVVIVHASKIIASNVVKLAQGKITTKEFSKNIGKEAIELSSSLYYMGIGATIGTAVIPGVGTVVGGVVGGMISSMLHNALFNEISNVLKETKLSDEKRQQVKAICIKLKEDEIQYRTEMNELYSRFFDDKAEQLISGFNQVSIALQEGKNIEEGLTLIANAFNNDLHFSSNKEYKNHIRSKKELEF